MEIQLNREQAAALGAIEAFLGDDALDAFILRGSAGTGKTTLIAKLVEVLATMNLPCALLAPTGRAARILGNKVRTIVGEAGCESGTIHRVIYSLRHVEVNEEAESANDPGLRMIFPLKKDEPSARLFVVDESSMVGDKEMRSDLVRFGSGRLLSDLVMFSRSRRPGRDHEQLTKLLFVGDAVQLPPVGESFSPALSEHYLQEVFGLRVGVFDLKTVMRQAQGSAVLERATEIRDAVFAERFNAFSLQPNERDIKQTDATGALNLITEGLRNKDSNVVVVHSNAAALDYNRNIRGRLWGNANLPIKEGDTLLVNKNSAVYGLSNGDLVKVARVGEGMQVAVAIRGGYRPELQFKDVTVVFRASDGSVVQKECFILENLLDSPNRELDPLEVRALLVDFRTRHPELHVKSDEFCLTLKSDPYFNALQVKYGYAMTCHKAQGGEWNTAIVDFSTIASTRNASFFRWAYTAITRAKKNLVVVNPPNFTATSQMAWAAIPTAPTTPQQLSDDELAADPDWCRFSFSGAIAPLMLMHQQLRSVWKAQDISIEELQHLQYLERYTVIRGAKRAAVQYYYDGKQRMGKASVVPGALSDSELADDALASIRALSNVRGVEESDPFIDDFLARLDTSLQGSSVQRGGYSSLPYRLRVTVTDGARHGEIDFSYNGKSTWTTAQEVGGPGNTHGLYEEVQRRMAEYKDAN